MVAPNAGVAALIRSILSKIICSTSEVHLMDPELTFNRCCCGEKQNDTRSLLTLLNQEK
jgi:hypothetical protein